MGLESHLSTVRVTSLLCREHIIPIMPSHYSLPLPRPRFRGPALAAHAHTVSLPQAKGVYVSALGGLPLFSSDTKFNSGTG